MVHLPYALTAAGDLRRALGDDLERLGVTGTVVDDAVLVASELAGNAVRHARPLPAGDLVAEWEITDGQLMLRLRDGGSRSVPAPRDPDQDGSGGRGLTIVEALAATWGVATECTGVTTVWATLRLVA